MGRYALHERLGPPAGGATPGSGGSMTRARSGAARAMGRLPGPTGVFVLRQGLDGPGRVSMPEAIELVTAEWATSVAREEITAATVKTHRNVLATLEKFTRSQDVRWVCDLDSVTLHSWYWAPAARTGQQPTTNTVALRQSVARSFFRTMALLGITDRDVTVAVPALRRPDRAVNPLTSNQVDKLKKASVRRREKHSGSAKGPAALALALLGLQSKEIPATRVCDIDFLAGTVSAHDGGARVSERHVPIDDAWAWERLAERVHFLQKCHGPAAAHMPVAYEPGTSRGGTTPANPAASTSNTLDGIFKDAGVKQPGRVRIASLSEYVAIRVYGQTGSLMEVAVRLGMRSLDAAAHIVDPNWFDNRLAAGTHGQ
jgi:integrase